jgi:hypothetical protein
MFRTTVAAVEPPAVTNPSDLIPLSVLQLDLDPPTVGGWNACLAGRGIAVLVDDIGRPALTLDN